MKSKRNLVAGPADRRRGGRRSRLGGRRERRHEAQGRTRQRKGHAKKAIVVVERATTDTTIDNGTRSAGLDRRHCSRSATRCSTRRTPRRSAPIRAAASAPCPARRSSARGRHSLKGGQIVVRGPVLRRRRLDARDHGRHRQVRERPRHDGPARDRRDDVPVHVPRHQVSAGRADGSAVRPVDVLLVPGTDRNTVSYQCLAPMQDRAHDLALAAAASVAVSWPVSGAPSTSTPSSAAVPIVNAHTPQLGQRLDALGESTEPAQITRQRRWRRRPPRPAPSTSPS